MSGRGDTHRAKRSLGQNFLIDPNIQRRIVEAISPSPDDEVLEIGPGQGALTDHLVGSVRRLVLVELDDGLVQRLRSRLGERGDVEIVHADFMKVTLEQLSTAPERLKVIGNIPYNITTPILFSLLERRPRPREIVLMVQREVAERIVAPPGSKTYGALAVGVQTVADAARVIQVGSKSFRPVPDVESTVIRILPHDPPRLSEEEERAVRSLTRIAFGQRRKQFQRLLRDAYRLTPDQVAELERSTGFDLQARPETFAPEHFVTLARTLGTPP